MQRVLFRSMRVLLLGFVMFNAPVSANAPPAPPQVVSMIGAVRLSGEGRLTWYGLKVYQARLWIGENSFDAARFSGAAFALELEYARSIPGKVIAEQSAIAIEALALGNETQRSRWAAAMLDLFPDVVSNDRLIGIHVPRKGVSFILNDRAIGEIADPEFGAAFFAIWLDPRTKSPSLRQAILAGAARKDTP